MRALNRLVLTILILIAAAALAAYLRSKGDRHRLGGAIDLAGSIEPVVEAFNRLADHPRLLMILAPACPVCLEGAEGVRQVLLREDEELVVLAIWMEALPFDITRNPARRVESFADDPRMIHFYDMQQVAGRSFREQLAWPEDSLPWDVYLLYPAGVTWENQPPVPAAWFHQREVANPSHYRTGPELIQALRLATEDR